MNSRVFPLCQDGSVAVAFNRGAASDRLILKAPAAAGGGEPFYAAFYRDGGADALAAHRRRQIPELMALAGVDLERGAFTHLDVGCGTGAVVAYINNRGAEPRSFGVDPSLPAHRPPLYRASLEELDTLADLPAAFDLITLLDVLEHFDDPREALARLRPRLAPTGCLLVKVPTRSAFMYRAARSLRHVVPGFSRAVMRRLYQVDFVPPHYSYFDLRSLTALLDAAGFAVERHAYVSEVPVAHLWSRLWGMSLPTRVAAFACLVPLKVLATGSRRECVAVVARPSAPASPAP